MSDEIVITESGDVEKASALQTLEDLLGKAHENVEQALSDNTRRAYRSQWQTFERWASGMGLPAFPCAEETLLIYLTHRVEKGASMSTITQAYSAIREEHRMRDTDPPTLEGKLYRSWTRARKKSSRGRTVEKAKALSPNDLKQVVGSCKGSLGSRDCALLLVGWCAALRRDEIVSLNLDDLEVDEAGLRVQIRTSKTDQMGQGNVVGILRQKGEFCPVAAWETYLAERVANEGENAAFVSRTGHRLSGADVSRILTRSMYRAGLRTKGYSAHSLRAGCITAAAQAGHSLDAIQRQSRHKSLEVLLGYVRTGSLLTNNVTKGLL